MHWAGVFGLIVDRGSWIVGFVAYKAMGIGGKFIFTADHAEVIDAAFMFVACGCGIP
jgi:hypothetical protein